MKASQAAVLELSASYAELGDADRRVVDELLAEWALSDDEATRFDALALIDEHEIATALPALQLLLVRLREATDPGAPYECAKVRRIVARLTKQGR